LSNAKEGRCFLLPMVASRLATAIGAGLMSTTFELGLQGDASANRVRVSLGSLVPNHRELLK
jgi:hypothetical protein